MSYAGALVGAILCLIGAAQIVALLLAWARKKVPERPSRLRAWDIRSDGLYWIQLEDGSEHIGSTPIWFTWLGVIDMCHSRRDHLDGIQRLIILGEYDHLCLSNPLKESEKT